VCCRRAKTGPRDEHTVAVSRQPTRGVGHQNVATSERLIATSICLLFASSNRYLSNDFHPCCRFSGDTSIGPTCVFLVTWINFVDCLLQGRLGRRLWSSTSSRLDVPPVRLSTVGRRTFPVSGATVWNDLPLHVASAPSLAVFRQ